MPEAAGRQAPLDRYSRELGLVEKRDPMADPYERVDPCVVRHVQGGIGFGVLVYRHESQSGFDNANPGWCLKLVGDGLFARDVPNPEEGGFLARSRAPAIDAKSARERHPAEDSA